MFVRAAAGLRDTAALRLCRDAAAGVFFLDKIFAGRKVEIVKHYGVKWRSYFANG
jgi:hypothetical protein